MVVLWVCIVAGMTIMAAASSFWALCAGRFLFSAGMNAHLVGAPKIIGRWFSDRRALGFAMGLYTLAFTVGVYLSLNVVGSVGAARGSAVALRILAALAALGLALMAMIPAASSLSSSPPASSAPPASPPVAPWALGAGAWVLSLAYFGFSIGTEAYLTFAPDFLVGTGLAVGVATAAVGGYGIVAFVLKPVCSGFLTRDRAPRFVVLAVMAALASIGTLVAGVAPVASSSLMGVALALGMPAFLALPALLFPDTRSGQVYGLYQLLYSAGFFAQPLVGVVADRTGSYSPAFVVVAAYTALGLGVASPWVRRLRLQPLSKEYS